MYSVGKHIFFALSWLFMITIFVNCHLFYRLIYVFDGSFKSQTRKSGATVEISTMDISLYPLSFYTCTSQLEATVYQKNIVKSGWR
jgi:hypothetical protein